MKQNKQILSATVRISTKEVDISLTELPPPWFITFFLLNILLLDIHTIKQYLQNF